MARRELPRREARIIALSNFVEEGDFLAEAAVDDVMQFHDDLPADDSTLLSSDLPAEENNEVLEEVFLRNIDSSDTDSTSESDQETREDTPSGDHTLRAPNGFVWSREHDHRGREGRQNVFTGRQGFRRGVHPTSRYESLQTVFEDCIESTVHYTNLHGRRMARECGWKPTTRTEINAFIGLHIIAGTFKAAHRKLEELWDDRNGHPIFRATMSCERFKQLKSAFRSDDPLRRDRSDPAAPVRACIAMLNAALEDLYSPGPFLTVDEQLIEFHGKVKFRRYIPTKPGKFGLLVYWLTDAQNSFPLKCLLHFGDGTLTQEEKNASSSVPEAIVMHLTRPYLGRGRNVTADNYFVSSSLSQRLLESNTTLVGTLRNNKREVPAAAKCTRGRTKGDTVHFYRGHQTLCSYWDKKKCPVILLSTQHGYQQNIVEGKGDIVQFYNSTKSGVDTLDKVVRSYSSKRKCRRWPYALFFSMLDAAAFAAFCLMKNATATNDSHYTFKLELGYEMTIPLVKMRASLPTLTRKTMASMKLVGIYPTVHQQCTASSRGRCHLCDRKKDIKVSKQCASCHHFVCNSHSMITCFCRACQPE